MNSKRFETLYLFQKKLTYAKNINRNILSFCLNFNKPITREIMEEKISKDNFRKRSL